MNQDYLKSLARERLQEYVNQVKIGAALDCAALSTAVNHIIFELWENHQFQVLDPFGGATIGVDVCPNQDGSHCITYIRG